MYEGDHGVVGADLALVPTSLGGQNPRAGGDWQSGELTLVPARLSLQGGMGLMCPSSPLLSGGVLVGGKGSLGSKAHETSSLVDTLEYLPSCVV